MEQNTEPITLQDAAVHYSLFIKQPFEQPSETFKAGAQWQKEQDKELFEAAKIGLDYIKTYMNLMGQNTKGEPEPGSALDKVVKAIDKYNY
jgi:hypothetical protein